MFDLLKSWIVVSGFGVDRTIVFAGEVVEN